MTLVPPPRSPDPDRLHVLVARLKLWLLDVCVWLSEWLGEKLPRDLRIILRAELRRTLSGARVIVFLLAVTRCDAPKLVHIERAHGAPRGFRQGGVLDNDMRNVARTLRLRGRTIAARLAELRAALDNLDAWVARGVRRLRAGSHGARLLLCAVFADRLQPLMTPTPTLVDSS